MCLLCNETTYKVKSNSCVNLDDVSNYVKKLPAYYCSSFANYLCLILNLQNSSNFEKKNERFLAIYKPICKKFIQV